MMSVLERPHSIPDTGAEALKPDSRLVFAPQTFRPDFDVRFAA